MSFSERALQHLAEDGDFRHKVQGELKSRMNPMQLGNARGRFTTSIPADVIIDAQSVAGQFASSIAPVNGAISIPAAGSVDLTFEPGREAIFRRFFIQVVGGHDANPVAVTNMGGNNVKPSLLGRGSGTLVGLPGKIFDPLSLVNPHIGMTLGPTDTVTVRIQNCSGAGPVVIIPGVQVD